eukprot:TRINITY_DN29985_c0_g1_i1.p1 TRINITY_DN29985_c0_g1~~TRINITY_DN29985_c0_g1_i1.p1  ORF type:complete len:108 (-),score=6.32 TRINITY_DN29985_c0_g1_i1:101-424(-)
MFVFNNDGPIKDSVLTTCLFLVDQFKLRCLHVLHPDWILDSREKFKLQDEQTHLILKVITCIWDYLYWHHHLRCHPWLSYKMTHLSWIMFRSMVESKPLKFLSLFFT